MFNLVRAMRYFGLAMETRFCKTRFEHWVCRYATARFKRNLTKGMRRLVLEGYSADSIRKEIDNAALNAGHQGDIIMYFYRGL